MSDSVTSFGGRKAEDSSEGLVKCIRKYTNAYKYAKLAGKGKTHYSALLNLYFKHGLLEACY